MGTFGKLAAGEIEEGYNIIIGRTNWLNQKGIRQWSAPIPEAVIRQRQKAGMLFGYWVNDELVAVVCLLDKSISDWGDKINGKYLYMATLVSDIRYLGRKYGWACATEAFTYAAESNYEKIYLDCVDNEGVLPDFYTQLGFDILDRKVISDDRVEVLMVKNL